MTEARLAGVVEQLRKEESRISQELEQWQESIKRGQSELKRIQEALAALGERPTGRGGSKRRAPTKEDVAHALENVLKEHGVLDEAALKKEVGKKLAQNGTSQMGLSLRMKEAEKKGLIVNTPGGFRLASEEATTGRRAKRSPAATAEP